MEINCGKMWEVLWMMLPFHWATRTLCSAAYYSWLTGRGEHTFRPLMDELLAAYRTERAAVDRLAVRYEPATLLRAAQIRFPLAKANDSQPVNFLLKRGCFFSDEEKSYILTNRHLLTVVPLFIDAMAVVHTLHNTPQLSLSAQQMVDIFNLTVLKWTDQALRNVGLNLPTAPHDAITVWVRADNESVGSDMAVTVLRSFAIARLQRAVSVLSAPFLWTQGADGPVPVVRPRAGYRTGHSSVGVLSGIVGQRGSIGVVDYADYMAHCRPEEGPPLCMMAAIPDLADNFVDVSLATVDGADSWGTNYADFVIPCPGFWALSQYNLINVVHVIARTVAPGGSPLDCAGQAEVARFLHWVYYSPTAGALLHARHYFAFNATVFDMVLTPLLQGMRCGAENKTSVWQLVQEKMQAEAATVITGSAMTALITTFTTLFLLSTLFLLTRYQHRGRLNALRQLYAIPQDAIQIIKASREKYHCMLHLRQYLEGRHSRPVFVVGEYRAEVVMLSKLDLFLTHIRGQRVQRRLLRMMRDITHPNVVRFFGLTEHSAFRSWCFAVCQFCPLGDLRTALDNRRNELDAPIKVGMLKGVAEGLAYLHAQGYVHGNLRSALVFLEADWTARISDWHVNEIEGLMNKARNRERILMAHLSTEEEMLYWPPLLWSAPEILNAVGKEEMYPPTPECDVYSFAVIVFEVMTRDLPYEYNNMPYSMSYEQLFAMIKRAIRPIRPLDFKGPEQIVLGIPQSVIHMMKAGWAADPTERPKMWEMRNILRATSSEMKRLADLTIVHTRSQIEQYKRSIIKNSEETVELIKELARTEADFLTQWVHDAHQEGHTVAPKFYQVVYVLHCSLVNYDGLCAVAHGDAVLYFCNRFLHLVDQILPPDRNMHRLHPNGDTATIVAAIPHGGVEYAAKMATLALDLLAAAWKADLLDIDWDRMEVRVGLACGPAVAGIYGNNHRAFTVTGIAHDEALHVESASAPYRILLTEAFYEALKVYPDYNTVDNLDDRHALPGRHTYWLQGQERYKQQRTLDEMEKLYPPVARGRLPETTRAAQSRAKQKQKQTKMSVQAPVGFYIQKDQRSGYTVEHYPEGERMTRGMKMGAIAEHAGYEHRHHHLPASHSQSKLFGSMLGPQGFTPYKNYKQDRQTITEQPDAVTEDHFLGQLGIAAIRLPVIVDEEETVDEAVQVSDPETDLVEIRRSAGQIIEELSRVEVSEKKRKGRKEREESLVEVIRKTSAWVAALPDHPGEVEEKDTDEEGEKVGQVERRRKKGKRKRKDAQSVSSRH